MKLNWIDLCIKYLVLIGVLACNKSNHCLKLILSTKDSTYSRLSRTCLMFEFIWFMLFTAPSVYLWAFETSSLTFFCWMFMKSMFIVKFIRVSSNCLSNLLFLSKNFYWAVVIDTSLMLMLSASFPCLYWLSLDRALYSSPPYKSSYFSLSFFFLMAFSKLSLSS